MSREAPAASTAPRLTRRVLWHVMLPLALTWLIGTCVAAGVASWFAGQAFDRALLDDAYSLSSNVHLDLSGEPQVTLTPGEVKSLLFDQVEQVYFAVLRADGSLVAGHAGLHATPPERGAFYAFSDISHLGHALRAVTLVHSGPQPWQVVVAQTMNSRTALLERVLAYSIVPQMLLLTLLAAWLWRGLQEDLRPLGELQQALALRDANDLAPVAVVRNSREIEGLASAVNALFERLGHSVRGQREFAGNVAHELRTPLAGIRALAEYGLAHTDPAVWREQLQRVATSQARASHLIDQLLALALADEARAALRREPVRLDELAQQAVLRYLSRADAQGVDLGARGLEEAVSVRANAALVEGILNNLIDNALRYGVRAEGGGTITVELAGSTLSVVDDGPGIPPERQRGLTQRWAQGADGQALGVGAGLGLSIVARYAQLLGAELTLANDADSGGLRVAVRFDARA